jgi:hypothetical protein
MRYMSVHLAEISKQQYYAARSQGPIVAERPLGFITTRDEQRTLFISDGGKFYRGHLSFVQTNDMFMRMKFTEVRQFIAAQFEQPEVVVSLPVGEPVTGA